MATSEKLKTIDVTEDSSPVDEKHTSKEDDKEFIARQSEEAKEPEVSTAGKRYKTYLQQTTKGGGILYSISNKYYRHSFAIVLRVGTTKQL